MHMEGALAVHQLPFMDMSLAADGRALSDWTQGSHVQFLAANGDGVFAQIERVEENSFPCFKHWGLVRHGKEPPPDMAMRENAERIFGTELAK